MIKDKLAALDYHEFFMDEGRYIKMINHYAAFIVIDEKEHVLYGYLAVDDYINDAQQIADLQVAFWQLEKDLKELRGW